MGNSVQRAGWGMPVQGLPMEQFDVDVASDVEASATTADLGSVSIHEPSTQRAGMNHDSMNHDSGIDGSPTPRISAPRTSAKPKGLQLLYGVDLVTLFGSMVLITCVRYGIEWPDYPRVHYLIGFIGAAAIHMVVYDLGGLYENAPRIESPRWLPRASLLTGIAVLIIAAFSLGSGRYLMPRGNLVAMVLVGSVLVTVNRLVACRLRVRRNGGSQPRLLLVGNSVDIKLAETHITDVNERVEVVGRIPSTDDLSAEIDLADATDVLLLSDDSIETIYPRPFDELESRHVRVYRRVRPVDTLLGLQRILQIAGMPFVALRMNMMPGYRLRLKRMLDLGVLALLSPFIVIALAFTAAYTRMVVGPGVIYRQVRVGRHNEPFVVYKFRTMNHNAEHPGKAVRAVKRDDRVVRGMAWIRSTRLDEFPQFYNVLRGEMSIVGPRPERPEIVDLLAKDLPGYHHRHDVAPGITGLAQIRGHYQTDAAFKLGHDIQYIVNWSPVLDITILVQSLVIILRRDGL